MSVIGVSRNVSPTRRQIAKNKKKLITAEAFAEMTGIGRAELVEGRIIEMPPPKDRHGAVENNFSFFITSFARQHELGKVRVGESGVLIRRNPDTVRGMDVVFISNERWEKQPDEEGYHAIAPDLIVEVLSPNDSWSAVMKKLREYFEIGVRLVWVADTDARLVYTYRSPTDVREFKEGEELVGEEVLPGFRAAVSELFAD
jgi:Uma2 family endonuclease